MTPPSLTFAILCCLTLFTFKLLYFSALYSLPISMDILYFLKQLGDVSRSHPTGKETGSECLTLSHPIQAYSTESSTPADISGWSLRCRGNRASEGESSCDRDGGRMPWLLPTSPSPVSCRDFPLTGVRLQLTQQLVLQASVSLKGELDLMAMCDIVLKFKPFTF